MSKSKVSQQHHATFESIRQMDAQGNEYWLARPLARVLEYSEFRHFLPVLERASEACRNSGQPVTDHFEDILEMVEIGSGARRELPEVTPVPLCMLSDSTERRSRQTGDRQRPNLLRAANPTTGTAAIDAQVRAAQQRTINVWRFATS